MKFGTGALRAPTQSMTIYFAEKNFPPFFSGLALLELPCIRGTFNLRTFILALLRGDSSYHI